MSECVEGDQNTSVNKYGRAWQHGAMISFKSRVSVKDTVFSLVLHNMRCIWRLSWASNFVLSTQEE